METTMQNEQGIENTKVKESRSLKSTVEDSETQSTLADSIVVPTDANIKSIKSSIGTIPQHGVEITTPEKVGENEDSKITATQPLEGEAGYVTGIKLHIVTLALFLAVFLVTLDRSIIATAIPSITSEFHSLDNFSWYQSAFQLTAASFQLSYGNLYSLASVKWTFLVSLTIFEVGSIICGVAPNSIALILGRAIAGLGAAGIYSGALVIVSLCVPMHKRPMYTGMIGAMSGIATVIGPVLGGVLTDKLSWRWCFYINYPIGAVTILVVLFLLKTPTPTNSTLPFRQKLRHFDLLGTVLFIPSIICLLLALQWGSAETYTWSSWRIVFLFVLFGVLTSIWTYTQWKMGERATLKFRILKDRSVEWSIWYVFLNGAATILVTYYLPIYFQAVKNVDAIQSGVDYIPTALSTSVFAIIGGLTTSKIGYCNAGLYFATVMMSVGIGLIYTLKINSPSSFWIGAQVPYGAGVGIGGQQPLMAVQAILSPSDIPTGISTLIFAQTMGGVFFVTIGQAVFNSKLRSELAVHVPDLKPAIVIDSGASGLTAAIEKINPVWVEGVLVAYMSALRNVFLVGLILAVLTVFGSVGMPWTSVGKKKKKEERGRERA